jgi:hypothetical protein
MDNLFTLEIRNMAGDTVFGSKYLRVVRMWVQRLRDVQLSAFFIQKQADPCHEGECTQRVSIDVFSERMDYRSQIACSAGISREPRKESTALQRKA